jgi:hypothetical protein
MTFEAQPLSKVVLVFIISEAVYLHSIGIMVKGISALSYGFVINRYSDMI